MSVSVAPERLPTSGDQNAYTEARQRAALAEARAIADAGRTVGVSLVSRHVVERALASGSIVLMTTEDAQFRRVMTTRDPATADKQTS